MCSLVPEKPLRLFIPLILAGLYELLLSPPAIIQRFFNVGLYLPPRNNKILFLRFLVSGRTVKIFLIYFS